MTAEQLRELADKFELSEPPPAMYQSPPQYGVSLMAHRMARFLREIADKTT